MNGLRPRIPKKVEKCRCDPNTNPLTRESPCELLTRSVAGDLQLAPVLCEAETDAVTAATATVNSIEQQIRQLQEELSIKGGSAAFKQEIWDEIAAKEKTYLVPAQAKLAQANAALQACRARGGLS